MVFEVERLNYFKSVIAHLYISVQSVTKQCSNAFTKLNRLGTNVREGWVRFKFGQLVRGSWLWLLNLFVNLSYHL